MNNSQTFYSIERDGITQSLLYTWLECRQKARFVIDGYSPKGASMGLIYGTIVHAVLEAIYTDMQRGEITAVPEKRYVHNQIAKIEKTWHKENTNADKKALEYLETSLLIAEATMPIYFQFWHKDLKQLQWERLENEFRLPFKLEDGKTTYLRGKMDGVFTKSGIWLFESKTKSRISEDTLIDMLPFELQINMYLWVLKKLYKDKYPKGTIYNIIRRIQLEQKKNENIKQFSERCIADIRKRPDFYFMRMEVKITPEEMDQFNTELTAMINDFYAWLTGKAGHYKNPGACENKYGRCAYLTACATGSTLRYEKRKTMYRELDEV